MSRLAIRVTGLGKEYRVGARQERYQTLRESLGRSIAGALRAPASLLRKWPAGALEETRFWALRDVSFTVATGEVIGVIGGNGAGKSTLLKLLSRVTAPSEGRAEVFGHVGSLLEVGTGFHPELSGHDNILLNGAILGMKRADIRRKLDSIVAFAEVERFVDTPVKHYSSGMYLRLAFAVAAHLDPEILLIDEVLAVGDAAFQKKCIGKVGEVARGGRTVLFVSHNMTAIEALCSRAVWLRAGRIEQIGRTADVISAYLSQAGGHEQERVWAKQATAPGNDRLRLHRGRVRPDGVASETDTVTVHTPLVVEVEYWNLRGDGRLVPSLNLYTERGVLIFSAGPPYDGARPRATAEGALHREACHVPGDLLNDGVHRVELVVMRGSEMVYQESDFLFFTVRDSAELRDGWFGKWPGAVRPRLRWVSDVVGVSVPSS